MLVLLIPFASAKDCHGVIVCGQKYTCGARDNVNPEGFGVKCNCPDPDGKEVHPLTNVFNSYKNMLNNYLGWIR